MTTPEELCTECLEHLNEAEEYVGEAKGLAENANSEADSAEAYAAEARQSADNANVRCGYAIDSLDNLRAKLEELSAQLASPEDSLAANMAKHRASVTRHHKAGWSPQRIADKFSISVVLVDLIVAQIEREAA